MVRAVNWQQPRRADDAIFDARLGRCYIKRKSGLTGNTVKLMRSEIEKALEQVRPALQADGGDVELVDVDESTGTVKVRFRGACQGCPFSRMTLERHISAAIKARVKAIKEVVAVED